MKIRHGLLTFFTLAQTLLPQAQAGGPGVNGGINELTQGQILDHVEASRTQPIVDFASEVLDYSDFQKFLSSIEPTLPGVSEYLSQAQKKKWSFLVGAEIKDDGCLNATLGASGDGPEERRVPICQWEEFGYIQKERYEGWDSPTRRVFAWIHEGLVHHMVKTLNQWAGHMSAEELKRAKATAELRLRVIAVNLQQGAYKDLSELNVELGRAGLPRIMTPTERRQIGRFVEDPNKIFPASELFVGAEEQRKIIEGYFNAFPPLDPDKLRAKLGRESCFLSRTGYSVPGYWAAAYLNLDPVMPSVAFSVQLFREIERAIQVASFKFVVQSRALLVPLKKIGQDWVADIRPSLLPNNGARLTVRQLDDKIVVRREVLVRKHPASELEVDQIDYGIGQLAPYPSCLDFK